MPIFCPCGEPLDPAAAGMVSSVAAMGTSSNKTEKFFHKAIDTMFRAVGFDGFSEEFVKQDHWYSRREWTLRQRNDFRDWFVAAARKDLKWTKRTAENEFSFFDLMWGWRQKEDGPAQPPRLG